MQAWLNHFDPYQRAFDQPFIVSLAQLNIFRDFKASKAWLSTLMKYTLSLIRI